MDWKRFGAKLNCIFAWPKCTPVLAIAIFLVLLRLVAIWDAPFINDEPRFQLHVDQNLNTGTFPTRAPFVGSQPIPYGPFAFWFYMAVRSLSSNILIFFYAHALTFVAALLLLYFSTRKIYDESIAQWTLLIAASSPHLFYYSRIPWDHTLIVFDSALVLYGFSMLHSRKYSGEALPPSRLHLSNAIPWLLIGAGCGMAASTHLMAVPLVAGVFCTACIYLWRHSGSKSYALVATLAASLPFILILLPYLITIFPMLINPQPGKFTERWGDGRQLWWNFMRTAILVSSWKIKEMFRPEVEDFYFSLPYWLVPFLKIDVASWPLKAAGWIMLFSPLGYFFKLPRTAKQNIPIAHLLALFCVGFVLLFFQYLNFTTYNHYFQSVWWVSFLMIAVAIAKCPQPFRRVLRAFAILLVVANLTYVLAAGVYLHLNRGTRGHYYGTTVGEQMRFVDSICSVSAPTNKILVDLRETWVLSYPLEFFSAHSKNCRQKELFFLDNHSGKPIPENVASYLQFRAKYLENRSKDAALTFELASGE